MLSVVLMEYTNLTERTILRGFVDLFYHSDKLTYISCDIILWSLKKRCSRCRKFLYCGLRCCYVDLSVSGIQATFNFFFNSRFVILSTLCVTYLINLKDLSKDKK